MPDNRQERCYDTNGQEMDSYTTEGNALYSQNAQCNSLDQFLSPAIEKIVTRSTNSFYQGESFMISCRYLSLLIMFFVFLANSCYGLGPYEDNGETIYDQATGLEWQKRDHTDNLLTWAQALGYCEDLNLAGYRDWRLPNKLELRSIVEHSRTDPPVINDLFNCQSSWYWSSTSTNLENQDIYGAAWLIHFLNGMDVIAGKDLDYIAYGNCDGVAGLYCTEPIPKSAATYARCVRSRPVNSSTILTLFLAAYAIHGPIEKLPDTGQTKCYDNFGEISCQEQNNVLSFYGQDAHYQGQQPSYRKNIDFTITDLNTNLIWQQSTADLDKNNVINSYDVHTWQGAVDYCAGLTFADKSDWRLPAKHELQSIVDYGISEPDDVQPTINSAFSSQPSGYWSATPLASDAELAWVIYFDNGNDYRGEKINKYHIRCVYGKP